MWKVVIAAAITTIENHSASQLSESNSGAGLSLYSTIAPLLTTMSDITAAQRKTE